MVTGGMTTDFKALDTQLMIESLGFVEVNFKERAFQESAMWSGHSLTRSFHFQLPKAMYGHCLVQLNETTMYSISAEAGTIG